MRTKGVTELRRTQRTSLNEGSPRLAFTCPAYGASAFAASTSGRVVNQSQNCWYCPDLVSRPRPTPSPQIQRNTHPRLTINQVRVRPTPDAKVREPLTHAREGVAAQRAAQRGAMELLDVGLALELRIDAAELLLAVDDLGVVPLERVPDGVPLRLESVPLREVACRDVTSRSRSSRWKVASLTATSRSRFAVASSFCRRMMVWIGDTFSLEVLIPDGWGTYPGVGTSPC